MAHWSEQYVGRPYVAKEFDCAALARAVQQEVFGRNVDIPSDREYTGLKGAAMVRAMTDQIADEKDKHAVRTDKPEDGDGVLLAFRKNYWHIGVYCVIGAEPWVLHAADGKIGMVVLHRVRELALRGYYIEGYYKWI